MCRVSSRGDEIERTDISPAVVSGLSADKSSSASGRNLVGERSQAATITISTTRPGREHQKHSLENGRRAQAFNNGGRIGR